MDLSLTRCTDTCRRPSRWGTCLALFVTVLAYPGASVEAQAVPPVETELVREAPVIRKLELSGTVTSPHAAQISTSVEGLVSAVHFDNGAEVKRGDLLLELDAELEEAAHAQAAARAAAGRRRGQGRPAPPGYRREPGQTQIRAPERGGGGTG